MNKLALVFIVIAGIAASQSMFAQDTASVKKKVVKVVKIKKDSGKVCKEKTECTEKMACCKDKKCCDTCKGEQCDGACCAKCAKGKKAGAAKCDMEKIGKCSVDSTAKCDMKDMKTHMEKKTVIKKEVKIEEKK